MASVVSDRAVEKTSRQIHHHTLGRRNHGIEGHCRKVNMDKVKVTVPVVMIMTIVRAKAAQVSWHWL